MKGATKKVAALMQSAKTSLNKKSRKSSESPDPLKPPKSPKSTQRTHLALPAELVSIVFARLDPFTVWMVCRNVSKLWRTEAETQFKLVWLPQLYFKVRCHVSNACIIQGQQRELSGWCKTTTLLHFSLATDRVYFSVHQKYRVHLTPLDYWNSHRNYGDVIMVSAAHFGPQFREHIQAQYKVINRIRTGGPFNGGRPIKPAFLRQRPIPNQIEIPGLKVYFNSNKLSFLWKEFFTQFFLAEIRHPEEEENCGLVLCRKPGCRVAMNKNSRHWDVPGQICLTGPPKIHGVRFGEIERIFGRSVSTST